MRLSCFHILPLFLMMASVLTVHSYAAADDRSITIMTAASTKDAMAEIATAFKQESGIDVKIVPGASNALATQIIAGAPAHLFLSANQEWADQLKQEGLAASMQPLLTNDLVLIVPKGNPAKVKTPADLMSKGVVKVALAGEKVPAGKYAEQALRATKLYDELRKNNKIARGQDVRVTLMYVERGEAEAGIVYSTDARLTREVEIVHTFNPATFDKIVYPLVLLKDAKDNPEAAKFYAHLTSAQAAAVFERHGFTLLKADSK